MVSKITETPVIKTTPSGQAPGATAARNASVSDKPAAPQPAARIGLSESAKASQSAQQAMAQEALGPLDTDLVREIRDRIAQGKFKIDYEHVASNLLREAVASTQRGR
jgi:flagellar biosynthesis anti-sigma factor FlgM